MRETRQNGERTARGETREREDWGNKEEREKREEWEEGQNLSNYVIQK